MFICGVQMDRSSTCGGHNAGRGALWRLNVEVATIKLAGGRVVWDLQNTNQLASSFFANNLSGELHLRENDVWDLQSFAASVMGAHIHLSGTLTNGSLVRDWR